ncbi:glycerate kinase [Nocardioides sp. Root79]|nr:glycerate kinase [Nocardioides sp. Root79]KRC72628.1 glycerate kinase [Nocardioides sp. Root240]
MQRSGASGKHLGGSASPTVLVAPDSFKGTYAAAEVAAHIARGARAAGATAVECPLADGGEGTYDVLRHALSADVVEVETVGPWRDPLRAAYALTREGVAIIELAAASGLGLRRDDDDALASDTFGTGLLVAHAAERGAGHIVIAAGGSATTDGGAGAVAAIAERGGLRGARITVLCDVTTSFEDAAVVFGPQKGADPDQVGLLTARLHEQAGGYPSDPRGVARTGAAGGFSGALWSWYGAELVSGADYVLDMIDFDRLAGDAMAIVVGEGRLDSQTQQGKIISAVLTRVANKPVFAVVGSIDLDLGEFAERFDGIMVASDPTALAEAGARVAERVRPA